MDAGDRPWVVSAMAVVTVRLTPKAGRDSFRRHRAAVGNGRTVLKARVSARQATVEAKGALLRPAGPNAPHCRRAT